IKNNLIKNGIIVLIAALLYPVIAESLSQIKFEQMNDFLVIISMLLVTVSFASFAFTYEKSKLQTIAGMLLAHAATGVFILLTALLLESITIAVKVVYPSFYIIILCFSILLYVGVILYDFWDLARGEWIMR
ncbi:hypothetical protein HY624_03085, partial [Candidatus Uhrbacteria bacterium]|nr:hypothetical protein [Candidatus Uhrbacteria bacterium]